MRTTVLAVLLVCFLAVVAPALEVLVADYDGGYTFADPDGDGPVGSEEAVIAALDAAGADYELVSDVPDDLSGYDLAFVLLGTFPDSEILGYDDLQALEAFAAWKGLYLEGGDVGYDYHSTGLWSLFGADYLHDGNEYEEGNVQSLEGVPGTWAAGLSFDCPGYRADYTDNYLDELTNDGGVVVFTGEPMGNITNGRVVACEAGGRTVVSSVLFGALADGSSTKDDYMQALLDYLDDTVDVRPASWGRIKALAD
ncbi:MAG: hypothetical protein GF399_03945 [Candidatus Coatesbacteria bacterium]|nr:hypothetical protein [Candidatus Coatesbacteria bacterium]